MTGEVSRSTGPIRSTGVVDTLGAVPLNQRTKENYHAARYWDLAIPGDHEIEPAPRFLYIKAGGTILVEDVEGERMSITVATGTRVDLSPTKILSTGTALVYLAY